MSTPPGEPSPDGEAASSGHQEDAVDKEVLRSFMRWLGKASLNELEERLELFRLHEKKLSSEGLRDLRLGISLLEEEIAARLALGDRKRS